MRDPETGSVPNVITQLRFRYEVITCLVLFLSVGLPLFIFYSVNIPMDPVRTLLETFLELKMETFNFNLILLSGVYSWLGFMLGNSLVFILIPGMMSFIMLFVSVKIITPTEVLGNGSFLTGSIGLKKVDELATIYRFVFIHCKCLNS